MRKSVNAVLIVLCLLVLAACDTWLGEAEAPPLPGKRLSLLLDETRIEPDQGSADVRIVLPAPSPNAEWPQVGGLASHAMHHLQGSASPRIAWSSDIGTGADDYDRLNSQPISAGGRVFTMDSLSVVSAFDAKTGDELWNIDLTDWKEDDSHIPGGLAYYRKRLYVTTGFGEVFALQEDSGKPVWITKLGAPIRAAPTARNGLIFVVTLENKLFALDSETGNTQWSYTGEIVESGILGSAAPAVDAGVVVAAFTSGEVVAARADDGRVLWTETLSAFRRTEGVGLLNHIRGNPVIDRGRVFVVSQNGTMAAIDLRTGFRIWERNLGGFEMPWVAGDFLFLLTKDNELVCLTRDTGKLLWVTLLPRWIYPDERSGAIVWSGPVLVNDRLLVVGTNGIVATISPYTGNIFGSFNLAERVDIAPLVADKTIFFLTAGAELLAFR